MHPVLPVALVQFFSVETFELQQQTMTVNTWWVTATTDLFLLQLGAVVYELQHVVRQWSAMQCVLCCCMLTNPTSH